MGEYSAYRNIELNDKTLSERVEKTLEQLGSDPGASVSAACKDPHQAKAVYRLIANEKFTADALLKVSHNETVRRIAENGAKVILIPQDTTTLNYSGLKNTEGLGDICGRQSNLGILLHSAIAVGEDGQPYGLLSAKAWVRPKEEFGKKHKRKQLPIEEKESYKWIETLVNSNIAKKLDKVKVIHVCDREGDVYEFFAKASFEGATYLCRRMHNRAIASGSQETLYIDTYIDNLSVAGEIIVDVPYDSHTKREARTAKLEIKFGKTTIKRPASVSNIKDLPVTVEVSLISAQEIDAPDGIEPISWQLVTNDKVETLDDAIVCVKRYTHRWKIEIFHRVLKGGCKAEKLQASTSEKLIKLIVLYSIIALQIMMLTFWARTCPDESCEIAFKKDEWRILYKVTHKTKSAPEAPPTVYEAVIMIAKLGGFLARKSDGFPGVTVIWRGLTRFYSILDASQYLT